MIYAGLRPLTFDSKFSAKKSFGQNYLQDDNIVRKIIASAAIEKEAALLEVGPGPGALTRMLLASHAAHLTAIEKDEQFIPQWLETAAQDPRFTIIHADALRIKLEEIQGRSQAPSQAHSKPFKIIANLPYNVGTQLILNWLEELHLVHSMTLMLQKEVVLRLVAEPGSKDYGRLSIITQWLCDVKRLFDVPKTAFRPQPKVTSSIVQITPRQTPRFEATKKKLEKITATAFQQRRKMIKKSLKPLFKDVESVLKSVGIDPMSRPETLSIEDFCALSQHL